MLQSGRSYLTANGIRLTPEISQEQFLQALIFDFETAARFILDWADADSAASVEYLAQFLAKVHRELNSDIFLTGDHYLKPRPGIHTTFGDLRPSISHVAFRRFCELLFESPEMIAQVQTYPVY